MLKIAEIVLVTNIHCYVRQHSILMNFNITRSPNKDLTYVMVTFIQFEIHIYFFILNIELIFAPQIKYYSILSKKNKNISL